MCRTAKFVASKNRTRENVKISIHLDWKLIFPFFKTDESCHYWRKFSFVQNYGRKSTDQQLNVGTMKHSGNVFFQHHNEITKEILCLHESGTRPYVLIGYQ
jgi:hypothetical protein